MLPRQQFGEVVGCTLALLPPHPTLPRRRASGGMGLEVFHMGMWKAPLRRFRTLQGALAPRTLPDTSPGRRTLRHHGRRIPGPAVGRKVPRHRRNDPRKLRSPVSFNHVPNSTRDRETSAGRAGTFVPSTLHGALGRRVASPREFQLPQRMWATHHPTAGRS